MKKLLMFFALVMPILANAQENNNTSSQEQILAENGSLLKKEVFKLPKIDSSIKCEVLIVTDMITHEKTGCVRLVEGSTIGVLSPQENDAFIIILEKILNEITSNKPDTYTEISYTTKNNVRIVTHRDNNVKEGNTIFYADQMQKINGWSIIIYPHSSDHNSWANLSSKAAPIFLQRLKDAKQMIAEKTK